MVSRLRARSAFTLIELLVVIAIIAILIGLLVPAVQKVREAAARATCENQLKQLALSCHSYHDVKKDLPVNWGGQGGWNLNSSAWSWIAFILPYLEQGTVYNGANIGAMNPQGQPVTIMQNAMAGGIPVYQVVIPLLRCPSDPDVRTVLWTGRADVGNSVAITNYKGVCGSNWAWGDGRWNPGWVTPSTGNNQNGLDAGNGVLWRSNGTAGKRYTLLSITDGTSNTFMIGESLPSKSAWTGAWVYANNASGTCAIYPNATQANGDPFATGDWYDNYSFHSAHTGGVQFAMCDGSVHFVSDGIAIATYRGLATIRGNEVVTTPE